MTAPKEEAWWKSAWRPAAAGVYLTICAFDFMIMPIIYERSQTPAKTVELALKFKSEAAQIQALESLKAQGSWSPLTTQGNGIFHVSFGVILGATAHGRSKEKQAKIAAGSA